MQTSIRLRFHCGQSPDRLLEYLKINPYENFDTVPIHLCPHASCTLPVSNSRECYRSSQVSQRD